MHSFLDLVQENFGTWSVAQDSGNIVFHKDAVAKRYNSVMADVQTIAAKQTAAQLRLVAPKK